MPQVTVAEYLLISLWFINDWWSNRPAPTPPPPLEETPMVTIPQQFFLELLEGEPPLGSMPRSTSSFFFGGFSSFLPWLLLLLSVTSLIGCLFLAKALMTQVGECQVQINKLQAEQDRRRGQPSFEEGPSGEDTKGHPATVESAVAFANLVLQLLPTFGAEIAQVLEIPLEHSKALKVPQDLSGFSADSPVTRVSRVLLEALHTDVGIISEPVELVSAGEDLVTGCHTGEPVETGSSGADAPLEAKLPSPVLLPAEAVDPQDGSQTEAASGSEAAVSTDQAFPKPSRRAGRKLTELRRVARAASGRAEAAAEAEAAKAAEASPAVESTQPATASVQASEASGASTSSTAPLEEKTTTASPTVGEPASGLRSGGLSSSKWAPGAGGATTTGSSSSGRATPAPTRGLEASRWSGGSHSESSRANRGGRGRAAGDGAPRARHHRGHSGGRVMGAGGRTQ